MSYQYVPYLWVLATSVAVSLSLCVLAWRNRSVRSSPPFFWAMALVTLWIAAQALEIAATVLPLKIFWANVQYMPIMFAPAAYLVLVLGFTGHEGRWRLRRLLFALIIIPVIVNALMWTDEFHGLMRQDVYLDERGPFPVVRKTFGPLFWVFAAYNFSITVLSLGLLARAFGGKAAVYKKQIALLFAGLLLPVITTAFHLSGRFPISVDPTPAMFGFAGTLLAYAIFREGLFDLVPVAHSTIVEKMSAGVVVIDAKDRIVDVNPAGARLFNAAPAHLVGRRVDEVFQGHPELLRLFSSGREVAGELTIEGGSSLDYYDISFAGLSDPRSRPIGRLMLAHNVTARKLAEEKIRHMAFHDHLTGLPNRKLFQELFTRERDRSARSGESLVVGFVDLDGFKTINDTCGHETGDVLLREVAARLRVALRGSDAVSRLGGDEFSLLLPGFRHREGVAAVARNIFKSFAVPVKAAGFDLEIRASIGFSVFPDHGDDLETLLRKADEAMYLAKREGSNEYKVYSEEQ